MDGGAGRGPRVARRPGGQRPLPQARAGGGGGALRRGVDADDPRGAVSRDPGGRVGALGRGHPRDLPDGRPGRCRVDRRRGRARPLPARPRRRRCRRDADHVVGVDPWQRRPDLAGRRRLGAGAHVAGEADGVARGAAACVVPLRRSRARGGGPHRRRHRGPDRRSAGSPHPARCRVQHRRSRHRRAVDRGPRGWRGGPPGVRRPQVPALVRLVHRRRSSPRRRGPPAGGAARGRRDARQDRPVRWRGRGHGFVQLGVGRPLREPRADARHPGARPAAGVLETLRGPRRRCAGGP